MKRVYAVLSALMLVLAGVTATYAQESPVGSLPWQFGPVTVQLGNHASLRVPDGYAFLNTEGTKSLNTIMQNPPNGVDTYALAPKSLLWVSLFSYEKTGYVKDNEQLNPDDILNSVREGTAAANKERKSRGWDEIDVVGWSSKPAYDEQIKSLAWAILAEDSRTHEDVVNYNTRLLGRYGVMAVTLVTSQDQLVSAIAQFKNTLTGFNFAAGETYGEYQPGDHVAEYGLAALITGGVAAVAAKKGLFAVIGGFLIAAWKFALIALVALGAWFKSLFKRE
ncbi:MAG: DUF2167 domain-containing protein [Herbaspirillum sp.]